MAGSFEDKPLWSNANFRVKQGVIEPKSKMAGEELGHGVIYYLGPDQVRHQIIDATNPILLGQTGNRLRCLWNPGVGAEIVNQSMKATNFFQVELTYDRRMIGTLSPENASATTAFLMHPEWPKSFRSSVRRDLEVIGSLAKPLVAGGTPSPEQALRAERAKQDLEFKLAWFNAANRKLKIPVYSIAIGDWFSFLKKQRSGATGPPGKGTIEGIGPSDDGTIIVTVNTKSPDGTKEARGYRVLANVYFDEEYPDRAKPFGELSTPTTDSLQVGIYWMWAEKGGTVGIPIAFHVGDIHQPLRRTQTIDLIVM